MADDITLTVRVRDLTRGDLARVRAQMRGMDGDVRHLGQSSNMTSERSRRLSNELQGVSGRLGQLQRTGRLSSHEMQYMRRTLGLLGRDLRGAARDGELSSEEFRRLSRQLDDTRLGFDRLTRDVGRHSAVARRAQQDADRNQQRAQRMGQLQARALRDEESRVRRLGQLQARAQNENNRRDEADRARIQRMGQLQARALRENEERIRRLQQQQAQAQRASLTRLAGDSGGRDANLTRRFRALGDDDLQRMEGHLSNLQRTFGGVSGSSDHARRSIGRLNDDLRTMSRAFQDARDSGNLTRRDMDALANGLRGVNDGARRLRRSGDLTSSAFRDIRRGTSGLQRDLHRLGDDTPLRRLGNGFQNLRNRISESGRWMKIFMVILVLMGPIAQALGAILITVLAGAFIALGAYALRGSAQVKSAFTDMKSTIGSVVREAAQPMEGALVGGMRQIAAAAVALKPLLTQAFTATAPLVEDVAGAVTDFAAGALPGMTAALASAGPAMQGFRSAMGDLGLGLGNMFKNMSVGNEKGLADAWRLIGEELQNFLQNLGTFIADMSKSASASALFIGIMRAFSGVLHVVEAAFKAIDTVAAPLFKKINGWVQGMSGLTGVSKRVAASFDYVGLSASQLHTKLDSVNKKIKDIQDAYSGMAGPAKKHYMDKAGYSDLVAQRQALEDAIAAKADGSAAANQRETKSIQDLIDATRQLNETNRNNLDARAAMEQAIDDAQKGYTKYHHALKMTNGQLDLNKKSSRDAYDLLSKIASATNDATQKAEESKAPWSQVNAEWKRGHDNFVALARGMGLSKAEARGLADQLVNMPDPKVKVRMNAADAKRDLKAFNSAVKASPHAHSVTLKTLSASAEQILKAFGLKVKRLPNGKVKITALSGAALSAIGNVQSAVNSLHGKTITVRINGVKTGVDPNQYYSQGPHKGSANGGLLRRAGGGPVQFFGNGGYIRGPGTGTSDSIYGMFPSGAQSLVSNTEYVVKASAVRKYGVRMLDALNSGRLPTMRLARGGVTKSERSARSEARGELTISHFGKMAGYKNDEFKKALGLPDALGGLVDSLNKWRSVILKSTHGNVEKSLLKQLDKAGKSLIKYEKQLSSVNKKLDSAKEKLDGLKQAAASLRDAVSSGVMSATDITKVATGDDKNITKADIMTQMQQNVDKSTSFAKSLSDLKKKGVSGTIISQIASAGIEGGGLETAGAMLQMSSSEIKSMNDMQKKINKAAKGSGKTAADAMYGAGIKAAEGLVAGLTKKKKDIEKAMMNIAKAMEKSIKKALGIKSPSRVMQAIGHHTAEGFAVGIKKNRNVDTAWASMLTTQPARSGGGGGGQQVIQLVMSGRVVDEIILDSNRRTVRTRGGNVQAVFGKRTA